MSEKELKVLFAIMSEQLAFLMMRIESMKRVIKFLHLLNQQSLRRTKTHRVDDSQASMMKYHYLSSSVASYSIPIIIHILGTPKIIANIVPIMQIIMSVD